MSPWARLSQHVEDLELHVVGRVLALSTLVGAVAGMGAILFQVLCQFGQHLFLDALVGYRQSGPAGEPSLFAPTTTPLRLWLLPVVPALGGLLTGIIVQRFAPEAAGHGTDEAVEAFHRRGGVIRGRVPIVKTIASAITLGSGGSGGREGPIAQIGAGFGSFLATRLGLSDNSRRVLLAAGVGAGVGSIFRAPLAGALFAAEVLYSDPEFESDVIIPAALASIIAYCVYSLKFGFGTLFNTPLFEFRSALELGPYTVLALLVAISAGIFVRVFYGIHDAFRRLPIAPVWRPALGGLATGSLALVAYLMFRNPRALDVLSFGYGSIQEALQGNLPLGLLTALAVGKILTTSFSIGSGGSGGVFGPSMVIGGALGGAVGLLAQRLMPQVVTQPGAYVAVGMAGFFAAAANTPVSTLVMVSEMTGNYQLLLPALWVCALSYLIGRRWTLYRGQVPSRLESPAHRRALLDGLLRGLKVGDILTRRSPRTIAESAPLPDIVRTFARVKQSCLPVVDAEGRLRGAITLDQVQELLDRRSDTAAVIAHDLASSGVVTLSPGDGLDVALDQLEGMNAAELPVVAAGDVTQLVGLLSRQEIFAAYRQRRLGASGAEVVGERARETATGTGSDAESGP